MKMVLLLNIPMLMFVCQQNFPSRCSSHTNIRFAWYESKQFRMILTKIFNSLNLSLGWTDRRLPGRPRNLRRLPQATRTDPHPASHHHRHVRSAERGSDNTWPPRPVPIRADNLDRKCPVAAERLVGYLESGTYEQRCRGLAQVHKWTRKEAPLPLQLCS